MANTYGYETCGVRLTTISLNKEETDELKPKIKVRQQKDVFLYRMGYYNYQKINMENMVHQYEGQKWYTVDIVINWGDKSSKDENDKAQSVNIFIDG